MTYNVRSFDNEITGFSAKEFAQIIDKIGVDVICFQEYNGNEDFSKNNIHDTYSKYYQYSFTPKERDLAIYSKYPISKNAVISFCNTKNGAIWSDIEVNEKSYE